MRTKRRSAGRAARAKLRSPGRPPVLHRSERRPFWQAIVAGRSSEDAARLSGVSQAVGTRWFRECGGMPPSHLAPSSPAPTGRYLSFSEREQIALARARGDGVREIAAQLARSPSTISRELRRNAATRGGGHDYRATTAQWHADRAAKRPKPAKLLSNPVLREYVQRGGSTNLNSPISGASATFRGKLALVQGAEDGKKIPAQPQRGVQGKGGARSAT